MQDAIFIGISVCCAALVYVYKVINAEVFYPPDAYYGKWFYMILNMVLILLVLAITGEERKKLNRNNV